jgi:polyhydroxybutyrate depolymerase
MNWIAGLLGLVLWIPGLWAATTEHVTLSTPDGVRDYWIALPEGIGPGPRPLVILLHGHGGSAEQILGSGTRSSPLSMWLPIVDRERIVAVALQGLPDHAGHRGWNDCRRDAANNPTSDDVEFVSRVIAVVAERGLLDRSRIYAMGMSNGAMMAIRLALELRPPLAAFAAVAGSMARDTGCSATPHARSALFIAGTADPLVPYDGGEVRIFGSQRGSVVSVDDSVAFWRRADGLGDEASVERISHESSVFDTTRAERFVYGARPEALQVELIRITGGGHAEPSRVRHYGLLYRSIAGAQNRDLESAEEAWHFFSEKRLREP